MANRLTTLIITAILLIGMLSGCSSLIRNPVPTEKINEVERAGYSDIRAWGGEFNEAFQQDIMLSVKQEGKNDFPRTADGKLKYSILILSGGGENGAFGAGVLYAWSKSGKRPKFKLVTGISTGALIAPFAFLGPKYDEKLKQVYTEISGKDIYDAKSIFALFSDESLADSTPLKNLVRLSVTDEMIKEIGKAHQAGRRLYIGTTYLDADRLVVWNMGKIAASGRDDAAQLFRDIMVASSSLPGVFPPVYLDAFIDGQRYDEMHVDGGLKAQMMYYGATMNLAAARKQVYGRNKPQKSKIYIIRNGKFSPEPKPVSREVGDILGRTISSMTKSSGVGDLYRIYSFAKRDGIDFNFIAMPASYEKRSEEPFDTEDMNRLFNIGYDMSIKDIKWQKMPYGLESSK
jgi:hypothetical protein